MRTCAGCCSRSRQRSRHGVRTAWRGLAYTSSASADLHSIDTTICALPTYVVRFVAQDPGITAGALRDQFWGAATFPDLVPPACSTDLSGAKSSTAGGAMSPGKPNVSLTADQVDALLERDEDVVFTVGAHGWGPLVARGRTSLVVSTFPVPAAARFAQVSVPGLTTLVTRATSKQTWRWNGSKFVPA